MTYLPIAGRGELTRLIAAAGGVEMTEGTEMEDGETKHEYMTPSGLPTLRHGDLKMSQSGAIEAYMLAIAPKYKGLAAQQRAKDMQYACIKEDILADCAKAIFITKKTDEAKAKADVTGSLDKWFAILEDAVPENGFVLGLGFPTAADLALVNITTAFMPFGAAVKLAGYDFAKWAKVKALCDRTAAVAPVAKYLASSKYTAANPFGM